MPQVTSLKLQKNKKRANVYLDERFAFGLDLETVTAFGLNKGQILTQHQVEKLFFDSFFGKLYNRVLNFLSYRPRSEKEVKDYLYKKLYKLKEIDQIFKEELKEKILEKLKKQKLLDDFEFASWWVNQRLDFNFFGQQRLRAELMTKGIKKEIIEKVLAKIDQEKLLNLAKKLLQKKKRLYRKLDPKKLKEKLTGHLKRRGFSWEIMKTAIDDCLSGD